MVYISKSTSETEAVGRSLAAHLEKSGKRSAFISLTGEMGVGKTAFTRGFASHFGISSVKSPTYTVVNEYHGKVDIFHFDMYRIESEDDLYSIGFDDYIAREGYAISEWSENVMDALPEDRICVDISRVSGNENERRIEIQNENSLI